MNKVPNICSHYSTHLSDIINNSNFALVLSNKDFNLIKYD